MNLKRCQRIKKEGWVVWRIKITSPVLVERGLWGIPKFAPLWWIFEYVSNLPVLALLISLQWSAMLFVSIYVFLYFKFLFVFVFIIIFFMSLGGKEPFDISVLALSSFPSHVEQNSKLYSASLNSQQQMPNPGPRTAPFLGLTWKGERLNICICGYKKGRKVHLRWWAFCDAYNVSILW